MAKRHESYFWTSYSDLMTSLFFVMLALFTLSIVMIGIKNRELTEKNRELTELRKEKDKMVEKDEKYEKMAKIINSTKDLEGDYFEYDQEHEKFRLKNITANFRKGSSSFRDLSSETKESLITVGDEIKAFLDRHTNNEYLVIIEGQASKDFYRRNYQLSYARALSLVEFWEEQYVSFGNNCELLIAGSGDGEHDAKPSMRSYNEEENQRFLIYIIPKNLLNED